ncbi:MAG: methyltransferase [Dysgonamonadaceae bacterium]|jgi:tRNA1Val (adenine37-N6)-methyltransferase|nr:methyltransferase [Dysgonamonadaceae bacterium]
MSNNFFKFKQFTVYHDLCAMKVGTDGVLLGAWAGCTDCNSILDVGTGSGLIALMMAQRSRAQIDAVEIDERACRQALANVEESPFPSRIRVVHTDYQSFHPGYLYDLIVSNPPYFSLSLENPDSVKARARHNASLSFETLIRKSSLLLKDGGRLAVIVPFEARTIWNQQALSCRLNLLKETSVKSKTGKPPKRILLEYIKGAADCIDRTELVIEQDKHMYSPEYVELTKDFYLSL